MDRNKKLFLMSLVLVFAMANVIFSQGTDTTFLSLQLNDFHEFSYNDYNSNKIMMNTKFPDVAKIDSMNFTANQTKKEKSTIFNDLIYFVGTAAIAVLVYILWPEDKEVPEKKLTFGKPPHP